MENDYDNNFTMITWTKPVSVRYVHLKSKRRREYEEQMGKDDNIHAGIRQY